MFWVCLKLYKVLDQFGEDVFYYDMDSVIYICCFGVNEVLLGDYLGELIDELDLGDYIQEFVSGGFKNYVYCILVGKEKVCVKGFFFNYVNFKIVNFDVIKDLLQDEVGELLRKKRKLDIFVVN